MTSASDIADARQAGLIALSDRTTAAGLKLWRGMNFADLDGSWLRIEPELVARVSASQLQAARGADKYTSKVAKADAFAADRSAVVPEAFVGVDRSGRGTGSLLHGAVTTTKEAVGSGLGRVLSFEAGAAYLAAMIKTALADSARSADMVSSAGRGYTRYARVVEPGACGRCVVLAGATQFRPFKRHPACKCSVMPVGQNGGMSPNDAFDRMSSVEQDRAFGKAGAEAIREGADISQVVSSRRGMGQLQVLPDGQWKHMRKTTIGFRPDGTPVQVYATTEGTTVRGRFGRAQADMAATQRLAGARYTSTTRVRLMPETIFQIAGDDTELRRAFLRDAGYLEYRPKNGYDRGNKWIAEIAEQRRQDRIIVNRATLKYGNFTLG